MFPFITDLFFPDCLSLAFTSISCCFLLYIASILFMRIKFTTCLKLRDIENPKPAAFAFCDKCNKLLQATTGARNRNLQVVITHASHVHSQHSLRMYGVHKKQFDHARSDLLLLVVWSARVLNICQVKSRQSTALEQLIMSLWTCDRCRPHSLTFGYY